MNKIEQAINDNPDLYKLYAEVERPDGSVDTVDLSAKFVGMTAPLARRIKSATATAGRGMVKRIYRKALKTNIAALERRYNNLYNEGWEGYIQDCSNDTRVTVITEEW